MSIAMKLCRLMPALALAGGLAACGENWDKGCCAGLAMNGAGPAQLAQTADGVLLAAFAPAGEPNEMVR